MRWDGSVTASTAAPTVPAMAAVIAAVTVVAVMVSVIAKAEVECDGRTDIGRVAIAIAGIVGVVGSVRWGVHAASEAGGQQQCANDAPDRASMSGVHGRILELRTCLDCSSRPGVCKNSEHKSKNPAEVRVHNVDPNLRGSEHKKNPLSLLSGFFSYN